MVFYHSNIKVTNTRGETENQHSIFCQQMALNKHFKVNQCCLKIVVHVIYLDTIFFLESF